MDGYIKSLETVKQPSKTVLKKISSALRVQSMIAGAYNGHLIFTLLLIVKSFDGRKSMLFERMEALLLRDKLKFNPIRNETLLGLKTVRITWNATKSQTVREK